MNCQEFLRRIVLPARTQVYQVLPPALDSDEANVLLLAIAGQESQWTARRQANNGPANGFWQCERGGMIQGTVLGGGQGQVWAQQLCHWLALPADVLNVWAAVEFNDTLAYGIARLGLWKDPAGLPAIGAIATGMEYYHRNWRPGRFRPDDWAGNYQTALDAWMDLAGTRSGG